jgi:hypothetical protein
MPSTRSAVDLLAVFGLGLGAVFGMAGTFVAQPNLQALLWAIDSSGLVMASTLLGFKHFRMGRDLVAAGFLVFGLGSAVMLSGTAAGPAASVPAFAAGTALWSVGLLLVSIPSGFVSLVRVAGLAGAILFAVVAARIFWGEPLLPTSAPLPFFAYPVLVMTFLGWIWSVLRDGDG